jgi:hypothetical protein
MSDRDGLREGDTVTATSNEDAQAGVAVSLISS